MKKEIYREFFEVVPARKFLKPVIGYYEKNENENEADKEKVKFLLDYLLDICKDYKVVELSNSLIDVTDIIKIIVLNYNDSIIMNEIMQNPNFNSLCMQVFFAFADKNPEIYYKYGKDICYSITSPYVPEEKLRELSKSSNKFIKKCVAANPNCPRDVFEEFVKNEKNISLLCSVARNRNTPYDILEELALFKNIQIKKAVAYNHNSSEYALRILAQTEDNYERINAIVKNHNCPADFLEKFATYIHPCSEIKTFLIRRDIARNPKLSKKAWEILMSDSNPMFRNVGLSSRMCPVDMLKSLDCNAKEASRVVSDILTRDDLPKELILYFAEECGSSIRATVISDVEFPQEIFSQELLIKYSKDKSKNVRSTVVQYLSDKDALMDLIKSNNDDIITKCSAVSRLFSVASEEFFEVVKQISESDECKYLIRAYIANANISEEEMWKIIKISKHWKDKEGNSIVSTCDYIDAMSKRNNLSEKSIERCIKMAINTNRAISAFRSLTKCRNFYSSELLELLIDLAIEGKLTNTDK